MHQMFSSSSGALSTTRLFVCHYYIYIFSVLLYTGVTELQNLSQTSVHLTSLIFSLILSFSLQRWKVVNKLLFLYPHASYYFCQMSGLTN